MENDKAIAELLITRGLQASGKSTWAKEQVRNDIGNTVRVNKDLLRTMIHNDDFVKGVTEQVILSARDALIEKFLKQGKRVICDDTNLAAHSVKSAAKLAHKHGAKVTVVDFDVDVEECIKRDKERAIYRGQVSVGEQVIRDTHARYFGHGFPKNPLDQTVKEVTIEPYRPTQGTKKAIIVDIDGTCADHDGLRSPYDYTKVSLDRPRQAVIETVRLYSDAGYQVIFVSGRSDICRQDTVNWLDEHVGVDYHLFMREHARLNEADYIIKLDIFNEYIRDHYDVRVVLDDRDQVIKIWRALGLNTYQVNYGEF